MFSSSPNFHWSFEVTKLISFKAIVLQRKGNSIEARWTPPPLLLTQPILCFKKKQSPFLLCTYKQKSLPLGFQKIYVLNKAKWVTKQRKGEQTWQMTGFELTDNKVYSLT